MIDREESTVLIERYLAGELSESETLNFEARLDNDDVFKSEFELHLQVLRSFTWSVERKSLKEKMNRFHEEFLPAAQRPVHAGKKSSFLRMTMVAASVSLLVTASALTGYYFITKEHKKTSQYTTLNRKENQAKPKVVKEAVATESVSRNVATAFAITSNGYLITNYHVVHDKKYVYLEKFEDSLQEYVAEVIKFDRRLDIAVLKINDPQFTDLKPVPFVFSSNEGMIGQKTYTLGYPKNDIVYSEGPISSLTGYKSDTISLQLSLPVNPGNSGAPVFNETGELMGVITGKNIETDGEAYSVKSGNILDFINSIERDDLQLPSRNLLKNKKITEQVKMLQSFIFIVKA